MDDTTSEQQFLGAPESDRLLAFSMALATESVSYTHLTLPTILLV